MKNTSLILSIISLVAVIALGIIVLLLGAYLVYALVHPERF